MSRFQAQTSAALDDELDELRRRLGLRDNQKADLLRELTTLAAWVVQQAIEGRAVLARGEYDMQELVHPVIDRVRRIREQAATPSHHLELNDGETLRLAEILDRGFDPPPALLQCLRGLTDPERSAPKLTWSDAPA